MNKPVEIWQYLTANFSIPTFLLLTILLFFVLGYSGRKAGSLMQDLAARFHYVAARDLVDGVIEYQRDHAFLYRVLWACTYLFFAMLTSMILVFHPKSLAWTFEDAFLALFSAFATGLLIVVLTDYAAKRALATTLDRTFGITKAGLRLFPDHRSIPHRLEIFKDQALFADGDSLCVVSSSAKSWFDLNPEVEAFRLLSFLASKKIVFKVVIFSPLLYFEKLLEPLALTNPVDIEAHLKKLLNTYRFSRYQDTSFQLMESHRKIHKVLERLRNVHSIEEGKPAQFALEVKVTGEPFLAEFFTIAGKTAHGSLVLNVKRGRDAFSFHADHGIHDRGRHVEMFAKEFEHYWNSPSSIEYEKYYKKYSAKFFPEYPSEYSVAL